MSDMNFQLFDDSCSSLLHKWPVIQSECKQKCSVICLFRSDVQTSFKLEISFVLFVDYLEQGGERGWVYRRFAPRIGWK